MFSVIREIHKLREVLFLVMLSSTRCFKRVEWQVWLIVWITQYLISIFDSDFVYPNIQRKTESSKNEA